VSTAPVWTLWGSIVPCDNKHAWGIFFSPSDKISRGAKKLIFDFSEIQGKQAETPKLLLAGSGGSEKSQSLKRPVWCTKTWITAHNVADADTGSLHSCSTWHRHPQVQIAVDAEFPQQQDRSSCWLSGGEISAEICETELSPSGHRSCVDASQHWGLTWA